MILIAVVIGYILGIAPFIVPKIYEAIKSKNVRQEEVADNKEQTEILNEWLNGPNKINEKSQEEIYNEYITGEVKGE